MQQSRKRQHSLYTAVELLEPRALLANALGVDVSTWQGSVNWSSMFAAGRVFAFSRATAGLNTNDPTFVTNMTNGKNAGLLMGSYHYSYPDIGGHTPAAEAQHFLDLAQNYIKPGYLPPVLDLEEGGGVLSVSALSTWANNFCNYIYQATGVKPMIYCNTNYATNYVDTTVAQWPLWIANWDQHPESNPTVGNTTHGWPAGSWKFHQYSATGNVGGENPLDLDAFNGNLAALQTMVITAAEVTVKQGATTLTDGQAGSISFGSTTVGASGPSVTFMVKNDGGSIMNLGSLSVPSGYTITEGLSSTLLPGISDTFTVQLQTSTSGTKTGNISFTTNDPDETPFNFPVTGTVNPGGPPSAPTNLAVGTYGSSSVPLSWTDNAGNETQFLIERQSPGGSFVQIGTSNANVTTYTDNTASPNTTYLYRVRASNGVDQSAATNDVSVTTLAGTPTGLVASDGLFTDHVAITWNAGTNATSYQLYRSTTNNASAASLLTQTNATSYDDTPPLANTTYYYWVASINSANLVGVKSNGDGGTFDTAPPTVSGKSMQKQFGPAYVSFTFNESVGASIDINSVVFTNLDSAGGAVPMIASKTWTAASNVARFYLTMPIVDGNFRATLQNVRDNAGNALTGTGWQDFYFLTGDANGDRRVNALDFNALASHYGYTGAGASGGDFNLDDTVGSSDFAAMSARWVTALPAPIVAARGLGASLFGSEHITDPDELAAQVL